MNPATALKRGHLLRDLALPDGRMLSDLRGRSSLVFIFGDAEPLRPLLTQLAAREQEFAAEDVKLVVALRRPANGDVPPLQAPVFRDDGHILAALQRQNDGLDPGWAVLVTDRFGEIFFAANGLRGDPLPSADDLRGWTAYIGRTCEECFPPEWPVEIL